MRRILFICVAVVFSSVFTHAQEPDANEILRKVAAVYAGCRSYADEGSVKMEVRGVSSRTYHFRTAFVRPNSFRFDFYFQGRTPNRSAWIVWQNGELIKTSPAGIEFSEPTFEKVLRRMTPISAGSSVITPQLLLPDLFRNSDLMSLSSDLKVTGEEKINGRQAFRIEGTLWFQPVKFWIDKSEYLILKIYRKADLGSQPEESIVQYKPRLNSNIPPEDLIFPQPTYQPFGNASTSQTGISRLPNPPVLRSPRLRDFGSSLSRGVNGKAVNGQRATKDDDDVVRIETDLVVCPVLVVDAQEKIVTGLTREDFIVKEDDKPQEVASFSFGDSKDLPRSIVLIIDYSASQLPYIRTSVEAAKMLVDKLNPKDRMAVVTDDVKLLVDFTSDKELLKTQLDGLKTKALAGAIGASDQYDALMATLNELFNREDIRPIIIFQTDGDRLEELKGNVPTNPYMLPRKYGLDDVLTATEKARATVYSVISGVQFADVPEIELFRRAKLDWEKRERANDDLLRTRGVPVPAKDETKPPPNAFFDHYGTEWRKRQTALVKVAKFTGAWAEFLERPDQADDIYTRVLTDIDRRYVIGYYPSNRERDGKRRKVHIEIRNHPEYRVLGQKSYFAKEEK